MNSDVIFWFWNLLSLGLIVVARAFFRAFVHETLWNKDWSRIGVFSSVWYAYSILLWLRSKHIGLRCMHDALFLSPCVCARACVIFVQTVSNLIVWTSSAAACKTYVHGSKSEWRLKLDFTGFLYETYQSRDHLLYTEERASTGRRFSYQCKTFEL